MERNNDRGFSNSSLVDWTDLSMIKCAHGEEEEEIILWLDRSTLVRFLRVVGVLSVLFCGLN